MSEGTKLGEFKDDLEFNPAVAQETTKTDAAEATKIGEISEFEHSLIESGQLDKKINEISEQSEIVSEEATSKPKTSGQTQAEEEELLFQQQLTDSVADYNEGDIICGIVRSVEK